MNGCVNSIGEHISQFRFITHRGSAERQGRTVAPSCFQNEIGCFLNPSGKMWLSFWDLNE